jgi:hypothetical protein
VNQLKAQVSGVLMEDQARSGQEALAYYLEPARRLYNPKSEFDQKLVGLFESIAQNRSDIEARIQDLHQTWKREGFWQRRRDEYKLNVVYRSVVYKMERQLRKTPSIQQLEANWHHVMRIVNGDKFSVYVSAKEWIGPPLGQQPAVEEPSLSNA